MIAGFMVRFAIAVLVISFLVLLIFCVKKIAGKKLSPRTHYLIWFFLLIALTLPFLPGISLSYGSSFFPNLNTALSPTARSLPEEEKVVETADRGWMNNFAVSVGQERESVVYLILGLVWILGILVMGAVTIASFLRLKRLFKASLPLQDAVIRRLFEECKKEAGIKKRIEIYSSAYIKSPIVLGTFKPVVILPIQAVKEQSPEEIRYILLHELMHCRYHDIPINYWICLLRVLYWFHPLVWYALREVQNDREIACDASVLTLVGEEQVQAYGETLISYARSVSYPRFSTASAMGGSSRQISRRIKNIAAFQKESIWGHLRSRGILLLVGAAVLVFLPGLTTAASGDEVRLPVSYKVENSLATYFAGYEGSFVMYDLNQEAYTLYNEKGAIKRVSPDSTYKIYSALFALEKGVITGENSSLSWNNTKYPFDSWNQDQDLKTAMKYSVNWYFKALDEKCGLPYLKEKFEKIGYGNKDLSGGISGYWMESSLKISPLEQVELLTAFYRNDYDFNAEHIKTVQEAMFLGETEDAALYGKTGTGAVEGKNINGWFLGYIEAQDNHYFFTVNLQKGADCSGSQAADVALKILKGLGIYGN